jgi:hypothetical protein
MAGVALCRSRDSFRQPALPAGPFVEAMLVRGPRALEPSRDQAGEGASFDLRSANRSRPSGGRNAPCGNAAAEDSAGPRTLGLSEASDTTGHWPRQESGERRSYENPLGSAFLPILDTDAIATCP